MWPNADGSHRGGHAQQRRVLPRFHRLGTIEPDKQADLVLIDGDPLKEIKSMRQVRGVMLSGRWVVPPNARVP